jgi:hypothetical protein
MMLSLCDGCTRWYLVGTGDLLKGFKVPSGEGLGHLESGLAYPLSIPCADGKLMSLL